MGILNVTPDSFSDGGEFADPDRAVVHGLRLAGDGADILDIGGESTRPYAAPVAAEEELRRVVPVIDRLARQVAIPISIDTSKAVVAQAALDAGAQIINDVTALADPDMVAVAARTSAGVCVMHMRGTPQTMQDDPQYGDVVAEVAAYLRERVESLGAAGIDLERIAIDPGIGFGKSTVHNIALVSGVEQLVEIGRPVVVGHSRKGFIRKTIAGGMGEGAMGEGSAVETLAGTLAVSIYLAQRGVHVLRVHDVGATRAALRMLEALRSEPRMH